MSRSAFLLFCLLGLALATPIVTAQYEESDYDMMDSMSDDVFAELSSEVDVDAESMKVNLMEKVNLGSDSSGRPLVMDRRTLNKLNYAKFQLKKAFPTTFNTLTVVQGSYRAGNGADASAGTHDKGKFKIHDNSSLLKFNSFSFHSVCRDFYCLLIIVMIVFQFFF